MGLQMNWKLLRDTMPLPNSIMMVGDIDYSSSSKDILILQAVYYIEVAMEYQGMLVWANKDKYNYPQGEKDKIVLQFQMIFPNGNQMEEFIKEVSP